MFNPVIMTESEEKVEVTKKEFSELINTAYELITKMKESHKKFQEANAEFYSNSEITNNSQFTKILLFVFSIV